MQKLQEKIVRFMQGRYGNDELNRVLLVIVLILLIADNFFDSNLLTLLSVAGLVLFYYRMLSRDISARYAENQKFINWKNHIKNRTATATSKDKTMRIFKCPTCGQKVRVPKGKGKISIHCPKCNSDFIKRS